MKYSTDDADVYRTIGTDGTTYGVSLGPAIALMGSLVGTTVLDFGAGTGRTARLLKEAGASRVLAVDRDANMLRMAEEWAGVTYIQAESRLPFRDSSLDVALSAHVLPEFSSLEEMLRAVGEIERVLRPEGVFIVVATNPDSIDCEFVSYRYSGFGTPYSGSRMTCRVRGRNDLLIQDYFWSKDDYLGTLLAAGFIVERILLPKANADSGDWLDETIVAPDLVIKCRSRDRAKQG